MNQPLNDHFSKIASSYASFRPTYPKDLYEYIISHVKHKNIAWDCATGNGQAARVLKNYFHNVFASDISTKQIENATLKDEINYGVFSAEKTPFADHSIDLITVAQALHWFNFDLFYKEVLRVLSKNGTLAVWCYGTFSIDQKIDPILNEFYINILGDFWPTERKYVDEKYETIPFPFNHIQNSGFNIALEWNIYELAGYLSTWSAVNRYIKTKGENPLRWIQNKLTPLWENPQEKKSVTWPLFLKIAIL